MIAALWLLLSASDPFGSIDPRWQAGLRGAPDVSLAQIDGDSCLVLRATVTEPTPYFDDYVRSFPRPVTRAEHPFCVAHIWLPPFNEWPTTPNHNGNYIYFGFRATETRDQNDALLWPAIFVGLQNGAPALFTRILSGFHFGRILAEGWWTLGLGWDANGVLSFYAAPGKVELTESDRFATDTALFPVVMQSVNGWFLDCAMEQGAAIGSPWYFGDVQLYADIAPTLDISNGPTLTVHGGYEGEQYQLQRSTDLPTWQAIGIIMSGDSVVEPIATDQAFYRLSQ